MYIEMKEASLNVTAYLNLITLFGRFHLFDIMFGTLGPSNRRRISEPDPLSNYCHWCLSIAPLKILENL